MQQYGLQATHEQEAKISNKAYRTAANRKRFNHWELQACMQNSAQHVMRLLLRARSHRLQT